MAGEKNSLVLLMEMFVSAAAILVQKLAATTYDVGDSSGWEVPADGLTFSNWAAQHTFVAGEVLVFDFTTGQHTHRAAKVTQNDYDNCNLANSISIQRNGPANYALSSGASYYICTLRAIIVTQGQKRAVVSSGGSPPSSPATHLSPSTPSGSTTNNITTTSPSTAIASASLVALPILMTFFC